MPLALVTGPTSGIGRAFATRLAAEGYDLVLVSRDEARLHQVGASLQQKYGRSYQVLAADLSDLDQTRKVEDRLRAEPFDMVVNNAGYGMATAFHDSDVEAEQRNLDVLVRAVMRLSHAALLPMLEAGRGDIINVSSVAGFLPRGTYAAHKAWVTNFSSWAGVRYRSSGVRVMALCPGFVRSEFHQGTTASTSGIRDWMWLGVDDLVTAALKDLRAGKVVSIPSARYKVLTGLARAAPRRLVERVTRRSR